MKITLLSGVALAAALMTGAALAQPPAGAPPAAGAAPAAAAPITPNYVTIIMETTVNKSAADTWARVGKYCAIGEWLQIGAGCTITSGKEGDIGSVRSVGGEIMVGKTALSYTYAQRPNLTNPAAAVRYNMYHGCLEAVPLTATTSKLVYTLMYDNEYVNGDKEAEMNGRRTTFTNALNNMKILAEGGTLPPPAARGGGGGGRGGAPGGGAPAGAGRGG